MLLASALTQHEGIRKLKELHQRIHVLPCVAFITPQGFISMCKKLAVNIRSECRHQSWSSARNRGTCPFRLFGYDSSSELLKASSMVLDVFPRSSKAGRLVSSTRQQACRLPLCSPVASFPSQAKGPTLPVSTQSMTCFRSLASSLPVT